MENNIVIRKAGIEDALFIAEHMRDADKREIQASHGHEPMEAMLICLEQKECLAALIGGNPAILFGCSDGGEYGVPWLLATDQINKIGIRFLMISPSYVKRWIDRYKLLVNYVHADNTVSIRWLKWLGFTMNETVLVNNERFIRFEMRCNDV